MDCGGMNLGPLGVNLNKHCTVEAGSCISLTKGQSGSCPEGMAC